MLGLSSVIAAAATQHLPGVLSQLEGPLNQYGYAAIAFFVLVEDFGVPVPGETVLIVGAIYAGTARLSVLLVVAIAFAAAVVGDNIGFAIGHYGGRPLLERFGSYVLLTPQRLTRATEFFDRHGGKIIVVARFIEGLRQANGIIAGISDMRWPRFLVFNAVGATLWVGVWTCVGYFSGRHIDAIYTEATRYDTYLAVGFGVLVLVLLVRRWWPGRRRS